MRRVIYQCDKCLETIERETLPVGWKVAQIRSEEDGLTCKVRTWCEQCMGEILRPNKKAEAEPK